MNIIYQDYLIHVGLFQRTCIELRLFYPGRRGNTKKPKFIAYLFYVRVFFSLSYLFLMKILWGKKRYYEVRLPWWSIGWDSMLSMQGAWIWSLSGNWVPYVTRNTSFAATKTWHNQIKKKKSWLKKIIACLMHEMGYFKFLSDKILNKQIYE